MVESLDISKITIDDLDITYDDIEVITVAKVGTTIFSSSLLKYHTYAMNILEHILEQNKKKLIISGIRNPITRNISYFFETYGMENSEPILKNSNNTYEKINTFICNNDEINNIDTNDLIEMFKNKDYIYHNHFTLWFEQFMEMTKINHIPFDKEKGLQLYKLNDDTYILFYVLEKYNDNKDILEKFFKLPLSNERNATSNKCIANKYKDFKEKIKFDNNYKDSLLNTSVMKYFYSDEFIKNFDSLY